MMDAIKKRALDILDSHVDGYWLEDQGKCVLVEEAVNAIIAALTPPEDYVLVPVEPTETMVRAGLNAPFRGHPETCGPSLPDMWTAMLAARPEVKNVND